jgi:hypothetical protein
MRIAKELQRAGVRLSKDTASLAGRVFAIGVHRRRLGQRGRHLSGAAAGGYRRELASANGATLAAASAHECLAQLCANAGEDAARSEAPGPLLQLLTNGSCQRSRRGSLRFVRSGRANQGRGNEGDRVLLRSTRDGLSARRAGLRAADLRSVSSSEQDGPRLPSERRARADRETREQITARPRCSDCGTESQQYFFRQRVGNRLPAGGLCSYCVDTAAPQSEDDRVDRQISVQRMVLTAMRSPRQ